MALVGTHTHRIDEKGRLALPVQLRDAFVDNPTCLILPERNQGCLALYNDEGFNEIMAKVQQAKQQGRFTQPQVTALLGSVSQTSLDGQGRIVLPERLREWAGIDRDASVVGASNHIEVYPAANFDFEQALEAAPDISGLM